MLDTTRHESEAPVRGTAHSHFDDDRFVDSLHDFALLVLSFEAWLAARCSTERLPRWRSGFSDDVCANACRWSALRCETMVPA
jgi:hypothetical protein